MERREFIALSGATVIWPFGAHSQSTAKVNRVGLVLTTSPIQEMTGPEPTHPLVRAFVNGLRTLGYIEGQNLVLERRSAEGKFARFAEIAAELVGAKVDVIVTVSLEMAKEAKRVTSTVPIVMATSVDPVRAGIVDSLARPGGNVTGLTNNPGPEFQAKQLQLLKEGVPGATSFGFLGLKSDWESEEGQAIRAAARKLEVSLVVAEHTPTQYDDAFARVIQDRLHALFVFRNAPNYANRQTIVDFAFKHRVAGMYPWREFVEAGGLMSYGVSVPDLFHRAAGYVDKILKGAKPADLPVEQPTKFELVINLKAAKALGLTIPGSVLTRADEVVE